MHELVERYERRRKSAGIPSSHVLSEAKVAPGTVWAWVTKDVSPNLETLDRVNAALEKLIAEKRRPAIDGGLAALRRHFDGSYDSSTYIDDKDPSAATLDGTFNLRGMVEAVLFPDAETAEAVDA